MKRFTLATLAVLISASSILALSPNANAESREQYCKDHRCDGYNRDRDYNYNRDSDRNYNRDRGSYQRSHDQNHRQRYRYYDRSAHQWRYGYR